MSQMDAAYIRMANQLAGALEGLPLGQPMQFSGGGSDLHGCGVCPTHCFRTVSQRSLNTPTRWGSETGGGGNVNVPTGVPILTLALYASPFAALAGTAAGNDASGQIFNDANLQAERQRIFGLVLIGLRTRIIATLQPITPGNVVPDGMAEQVAAYSEEVVDLEVFHTSDRNDPWIDKTPLKYFQRENDEFLPVPPVKWVDRDPAMRLTVSNTTRGGSLANNGGAFDVYAAQDLDANLMVVVESLFIPDPDTCGRFWPGQLCDKSAIGNTPGYVGASIPTARKTVS